MDGIVTVTPPDYKKKLDLQVAKYFFATNTPFYHASNQEFVKTIKLLRPGYIPPSRKQIGGKHITLELEVNKEVVANNFKM